MSHDPPPENTPSPMRRLSEDELEDLRQDDRQAKAWIQAELAARQTEYHDPTHLSPSEIESLRREHKRASAWMQAELARIRESETQASSDSVAIATPATQPSLSPDLGKKLAALSPESLQRVLTVSAKMSKRIADREATGQTDLTKPFDPTVKPIKPQG